MINPTAALVLYPCVMINVDTFKKTMGLDLESYISGNLNYYAALFILGNILVKMVVC